MMDWIWSILVSVPVSVGGTAHAVVPRAGGVRDPFLSAGFVKLFSLSFIGPGWYFVAMVQLPLYPLNEVFTHVGSAAASCPRTTISPKMRFKMRFKMRTKCPFKMPFEMAF